MTIDKSLVCMSNVGYVELERDRIAAEGRLAVEKTRNEILNAEQSKRKLLEKQIEGLQHELSKSQSSLSQISSIRQNLEREKELDLLTIKKELLSQKEQQLQDIKRDMNGQKEELKRLFQIEMDAERREFEAEKNEMRDDVEGFAN
jgi:hypothetical protein